MAPSTPRLAACAAAVTSGLLALTTGPALSTHAAGAPAELATAAASGTAVPAAAQAPGHALLGRAAAHPAPAPAAAAETPAAQARSGRTASLAIRRSTLLTSEDTVRRTASTLTSADTKSLLQKSLDAARRGGPKVALTPAPSPTPTASSTPAPTPAPTPTATPTASVAPSPTVTSAPSPTPTATAASTPAPSPTPTVTVSPTASASPTPTSTLSPSGVSAPVGDLVGWKQAYREDFGTPVATGGFPGTAYGSHWGVYNDGWKDTSKNGTYMPSKVMSVHDGVMDYFIHTENGVHMVSAPWVTTTKGQTYGRYSVRFRSESLPGYKTAWLLWPDSERWPDDGEIDFPEGNLGANDQIHAFHHYATAAGGQDAYSTGLTYQSWHTATVEWSPGKVVFLMDDKVVGTSTKYVPSTPMHWVLQTESNLDGYAPSSTVSGHVYVDWVAVWTKA